MKIALMQLLPAGSESENRKKGAEWCRRAKDVGADVALFPEMWSCGYSFPRDVDALRAAAIAADGDFVNSFGELAARLQMAVGITFLEQYEPSPRNSFVLFDRFGRRVLSYAKVHTCDFGEERVLTAGNCFPVSELDTAEGKVKVGAMICYDREFPESARILMLEGAELILVPNACPMEINRLSQLRGRAYENMLAIATANYPSGQPDCNGHSTAFDGIAWRESDPVSRDTLLVEAGEAEGIYTAVFPIDELRKYRSTEIHGNAYRHPGKYHALISREIHEPFLRRDYRE